MEKAVTRTFHFNACECHIYDTGTDSASVQEFLVPKRIKTPNKCIDYIKKHLPDGVIFMRILSRHPKDVVYAITEENFRKYGVMISKKEEK